jgi:AraC-like DNA-binding protein
MQLLICGLKGSIPSRLASSSAHSSPGVDIGKDATYKSPMPASEVRKGSAEVLILGTLEERYLTDLPVSIGEIAYLLGYSEPAAFTRAFRRWHQETPQRFASVDETIALNQ